eukprot:269367_1
MMREILHSIHSTKSSHYSNKVSRPSISDTTSELPEVKHQTLDELKVPQEENDEIYRVALYKIDFSQFLIMMAHKMQNPDDEKEIRDAFKLFDTNNDGVIEKDKLMKAMITVGEPLTKREVSLLFQHIGDKNESTIDYEDFMSFMLSDDTLIYAS